MKENEFVEMKLDSPTKSAGSTGIKTPRIESGGSIQFEDKEEDFIENKKIDDDQEASKKNCSDLGMKKDQRNLQERNNGGGLHIWKWRITGIGALCSLGITAATIYIFIIGNRKKHHQQNQKFRFQIYAEDNEKFLESLSTKSISNGRMLGSFSTACDTFP
ncbi:uncharacterized protein LOC113301235 isoform X1 [Papaver somniferum]|uniref:uncharacterized protein LOC113301235 isoform X1 n=1 Tax=Papaver somniferum TaxID=3469 RepID=UPI000E6F74D5|nr:uncharacterized protein LOC113301235 isoform X1 [Papaver somniferum]